MDPGGLTAARDVGGAGGAHLTSHQSIAGGGSGTGMYTQTRLYAASGFGGGVDVSAIAALIGGGYRCSIFQAAAASRLHEAERRRRKGICNGVDLLTTASSRGRACASA